MARFDYDVVIIGSGFGGSVAALRAAEKGYRVGVMEVRQALEGRRHPDEPVGSAAHEVSPRYARFLNNATHWGFGLATGAGYVLGSRKPKVWFGLPFGAAVWASGYVVFPQLGVYEPIWKYDLETLRKDLSAHLVFGTATAAAFCLLATNETRKELQ
jgi:choline dehydrogenase-like flavoprotein